MNNIKELPPIREIKSTEEIKIGDVLVYTGNPRGTGMYVPEIGETWEMKSKDDLIHASIEIIERGRGWRPLLNSEQNVQGDGK
jgi:hypothetical protein